MLNLVILSVVMLNGVMLNVDILGVVMLSVVAPENDLKKIVWHFVNSIPD